MYKLRTELTNGSKFPFYFSPGASSCLSQGGSWSPHPLWASHSPREGMIMPGLPMQLDCHRIDGENVYNAHALMMVQTILSAHVISKIKLAVI